VAGWERRLRGLPESRRGDLRVLEAATPRSRLLGLMGIDDLPEGVGLHLRPTRSVHTFGMRFPLDLLWLDARGEVLRVDRSVPPRRVVGCRAARSVIEVRAWYAGSR
jgi:uncharacterized membrane protein (UPF0127 family)